MKPLRITPALLGTLLVGLAVTTASAAETRTAQSPMNRVVLLELYTSEGCSSCPPADRFLSALRQTGTSDLKVIPLAFHVTYWDYIGWQDRFADKDFDRRQRLQAQRQSLRTIYTPQFMMAGDDYRRLSTFSSDIEQFTSQPASIDLEIRASLVESSFDISVSAVPADSTGDRTGGSALEEIGLYLAVVENNLSSEVDDGENEGSTLQHDFVVRELHGPFSAQAVRATRLNIDIRQHWKSNDLQLVAFAEHQVTGEVLQAVRLDY